MLSPRTRPNEEFTLLNLSRSMKMTAGLTVLSVLARATTRLQAGRGNSSRLGRPVRLQCTASCSRRSWARLTSETSRNRPTQRSVRPSEFGTLAASSSNQRQLLSAWRRRKSRLYSDAGAFLRRHQHDAETLLVGRVHVLQELIDLGRKLARASAPGRSRSPDRP